MNYAAVAEAERLYAELVLAKSKDEVAEIMRGATFWAFVELDERPGQFSPSYAWSDWHVWLRQLRNDPASDLFENFTR